jgi:ribose/xylose/arabinose/galactoside ABC-type transport system permease subunit
MRFTRPLWKTENIAEIMMLHNRRGSFRIRNVLRYGTFIIFGALILFFSLSSKSFFTLSNALLILQQAAPLGIVAIGMTLVLVVAGIDISIGQGMFLVAVVIGTSMEIMKSAAALGSFGSFLVIYSAAILIGAMIGSLNGLFIARFKVIPFLVTLATMGIMRGLALMMEKSRPMYVSELGLVSNGKLYGIPYVVGIFLALVLLGDHVLRRTPYGRQLMAIGNDPQSAQRVGINVTRNVFIAYLLCGIMTGIGAVLEAGQIQSIAMNFASGHEFVVISAVVLGGTSLFGGQGSILPGAILGICLVTTVFNGMTMMNASPYAYAIVRGAIIFLAVMADSVNYKGELR